MKTNSINKGMIEENSKGIGEISTGMVEDRAEELALIAGHSVSTDDENEQALRELTGGEGLDAKQASLESFSEDKRWAPIPSSTGHRVEESSSGNEDEDEAQLYEEGVIEAAHDQMLQAALAEANTRPSAA